MSNSSRTGRKWLLSGMAAVAAIGLAACGNSGGGTQSGGEAASGGESGAASSGIKVAFVPKIQGIPFFEAMNTGGQDAAKEFGFDWVYSGATTADPAAQADVARSLIQQGVNAMAVAPNDPDSMAPVIKDAIAAGIKTYTADTDATSSEREFFVSQASAEGIGGALIKEISDAVGGKGNVAIVSCGRTAANLNSWIDVINEKIASEYKDIKIVDTVYADEDQAKAVTMSKDLMNAHPDLNGLIGMCTTSAPGVAQAVTEAGKIGTVQTVGVGTPQAMLPFLESGAAHNSVLWNVEDHGYLTAWAGWQAAEGKEFPSGSFDVGRIKGVTYDPSTKVLLMGDPLILTKDNAGDFNY